MAALLEYLLLSWGWLPTSMKANATVTTDTATGDTYTAGSTAISMDIAISSTTAVMDLPSHQAQAARLNKQFEWHYCRSYSHSEQEVQSHYALTTFFLWNFICQLHGETTWSHLAPLQLVRAR